MSFTFCTSQAIIIKAGANVSTTASTSGAILEQYSDHAEAQINLVSHYDYITNYASLSANYKGVLAQVASDLAAIYLISYDMSGYTNRGYAEDTINILNNAAIRGLSLLKSQPNVAAIRGLT